MSNTGKLLISVLSVFVLAIGTIFLWTQNAKENDLEIPSISRQTEFDGESSQDQKRHVKTPKKRPLLSRKHTRQSLTPIEPVPLSPVNDSIPLLQSIIDTSVQLSPLIPGDSIFNIPVQLSPLNPGDSIARIMYLYNQGKIDLEYVVNYLESQHHYEPAILEKLKPRRAFKYFERIVVSRNIVKAYAERILAKDPNNPDAQVHMVRYVKEDSKAINLYQQILTKHPDHPNTLSALGYRLLDHSPEEAIQYLKKANLLDSTLGLMGLGREYEKLGDVKTAWFCYKKSITIRNRENREKRKFPPPQICILYGPYSDESNLRAIDGGKYWKTAIKLVSDPNGTVRRMVSFESVDAQKEREIREFYQFRDWVNNIENRKLVNQRNNFLVREVEKHLAGGKPMFDLERIVHAYEITTRYPGNEGIQHLKKTDIEVALEIERFLFEE